MIQRKADERIREFLLHDKRALLVTGVQGSLSESEAFLSTWTLVMGGLFVLIVLFMPRGLAGIVSGLRRRDTARKAAAQPSHPVGAAGAPAGRTA